MMRRLDGALLDRGWQPIANGLAAWWSPYDAAGFLAAGFLVSHTAYEMRAAVTGATSLWWAFISIVGTLPVTGFLMLASQRAARHSDSGRQTMNPERSVCFPIRIVLLACLMVGLTLDGMVAQLPDLFDLATLLLLSGFYFVACEHHPPLKLNAVTAAG
jgi:hypothetical protein